MYKVSNDEYRKLLRENITKAYRKADDNAMDLINHELKHITNNMNLGDRVKVVAEKEAFITLKDHKDNFPNNPTCRLINPAKSNLGRVSKVILENINSIIRSETKANQWRNSDSVIDWFGSLPKKQCLSFLMFDIVDFYPSISESLLQKSLEFARQFTDITPEDVRVIMHARRSILFSENNVWCKKNNPNMFDVTMGSYDGAEVCELVGLFMLDKLRTKFNNENIGLYRDDGLAAFRNMGPRTADKIKKQFIDAFKEYGLRITIESNLKIVNYLDITLDLSTGKYYPYRKHDNPPQYIHTKSNHPPQIIKQLPTCISDRISRLSYDETEFNKAATQYNEGLKSSGFKVNIEYKSARKNATPNKAKRRRKITWFNPPYSRSVRTNVGHTFLSLVDKHFTIDNPLHKLFNRSNMKVSYSCMSNMANIIKSHNTKIQREQSNTNNEPLVDKCNCRDESDCPLNGECKTSNIVYEATVTAEDQTTRNYIGMTEHSFKTRYADHKQSFERKKYATKTSLSKYLWKLKESGKKYSIKWSIMQRARAYRGGSRQCNLCLAEKLCILNADKRFLLNKKSELISLCRHKNKFLC